MAVLEKVAYGFLGLGRPDSACASAQFDMDIPVSLIVSSQRAGTLFGQRVPMRKPNRVSALSDIFSCG